MRPPRRGGVLAGRSVTDLCATPCFPTKKRQPSQHILHKIMGGLGHFQRSHPSVMAKTVKNHWQGIVQWKVSQIKNGILEGLTSIIQAAKRKARGYKMEHFKIMTYLLTGKLDLTALNPALPTRF